jgi:glycosyltransferase involved in cell wall biosynthesis
LWFRGTLGSVRILVDYRPALRDRTGVGEYVHELVRALLAAPARNGTAITLFTSSWADRPSPTVTRDLAGVRIEDRRVPVRLLTWAWHRLGWPPLEVLAGRHDVAHAASPLTMPSRSAAQVVTIHDLHFLRHPERMTAEMRRDFPRLVHRHAARAHAIVTSSRYGTEDVIRTLGVPAERVYLCPPGPPPWAAEVRDARQSGLRPEHILFVGTVEPRKNIGVLLDAYAELLGRQASTPPLILAGSVSTSARHWIDRAGRGALARQVVVAGYVTDVERRALFERAHMLVLPSLDEGFGLPVLEAMSAGVPVVVSSGGSLPEVAGDAATPVDPADVTGFADAMEALLDSGAGRQAADRGRKRAAAYSWATAAESVQRAYREAMSRR